MADWDMSETVSSRRSRTRSDFWQNADSLAVKK